MSITEIYILTVILVGAVIGISYAYRVKQMKKQNAIRRAKRQAEYESKFAKMNGRYERERQEELDRQKLRNHPNYSNPQFDPLNLNALKSRETVTVQKNRYQTQTVSNNSIGIQSGGTVYVDSSNDLLNAMILNKMMMTDNDQTTGRVTWNDDIPKFTETSAKAPRSSWDDIDSSSTSSSSYSSFDDSSSRSSYSSSSSDSSYSSSSSDSSSSSWD